MRRVASVAVLALLVSACAPTTQERLHVYNDAGLQHYQHGEYDRAREDFQAALTLRPNDPELQFNLAQCYENLGQISQAEQIYRSCILQDANEAKCRHALNVLLVKRGRMDEAQRLSHDWLVSQPKSAAAYAEDGWLYQQEGDPFKAIKRYQQAINLDPRDTYALVEMGRIYEEALNNPSRALQLYQTALDYDPHQAEVVQRVNRLRARGVGAPRPDS